MIIKQKPIKKQIHYLFVLLILISTASAITLDELINSYDHNYNAGIINITSFTDQMIDSDSNGINDTLVITLTLNTSSGNYYFVTGLDDIKIVTKEINKTLTSNLVNITFNTSLLSQSRFNYSIKVYDQDTDLIYEKHRTETNTYPIYEEGISITSISDQNVGNDLIRFTINLNVTENQTANITLYLNYSNATISSTKEETLTSPSQEVELDFDNETIKSIHYNGVYIVDSISIGDKLIDRSDVTSSYDYETFAKTSYFKQFNDTKYDITNNISKYLQMNFTINFKSTGTYTIEARLYDLYRNYIANVSKTQSITSTGIQSVLVNINGTDIYKSGYDGPYLLSYAKLIKSGQTIDFITEPHITEQYYYDDFKKPQLADLTINITSVTFDEETNISTVELNVSNIGQVPAINILIDLFDNDSYSNTKSLGYLNESDSQTYSFNVSDTEYNTLFTSIVDFDNYVDESNESNNIAQETKEQTVSLTIDSLTEIYSVNTTKIFEISILNDGDSAVSQIAWQFQPGDGYRINSTYNMTLSHNENALVYIEYEYESNGNYTITANATGMSASANKSLSITVGSAPSYLDVYNFSILHEENSVRVFEFSIRNLDSQIMSNINWTLNTGEGIIYSDQMVTLNPGETAFVMVGYNYSQPGYYSVTASATNETNQDSAITTVNIKHAEVSNLSTLYQSANTLVYEFFITNYLSAPISQLAWNFDTGEGYVINGTTNTTLQPDEAVFVYVEYQYASAGTYYPNATAVNGALANSGNISVTIS